MYKQADGHGSSPYPQRRSSMYTPADLVVYVSQCHAASLSSAAHAESARPRIHDDVTRRACRAHFLRLAARGSPRQHIESLGRTRVQRLSAVKATELSLRGLTARASAFATRSKLTRVAGRPRSACICQRRQAPVPRIRNRGFRSCALHFVNSLVSKPVRSHAYLIVVAVVVV